MKYVLYVVDGLVAGICALCLIVLLFIWMAGIQERVYTNNGSIPYGAMDLGAICYLGVRNFIRESLCQ